MAGRVKIRSRTPFSNQYLMAQLEILIHPDPRLRQVAVRVDDFNDEIKTLVADMAETMYAANGLGLAAVQVNVAKRVIVMDLSEDGNDLKVFVNPEIVEREGEQEIEEGCLSVPGIYAAVERAKTITLRAQDEHGRAFELKADDLLAVCLQHETDHLDGKMFVDYLSRLKQDRIRKKLNKNIRHEAVARVA